MTGCQFDILKPYPPEIEPFAPKKFNFGGVIGKKHLCD